MPPAHELLRNSGTTLMLSGRVPVFIDLSFRVVAILHLPRNHNHPPHAKFDTHAVVLRQLEAIVKAGRVDCHCQEGGPPTSCQTIACESREEAVVHLVRPQTAIVVYEKLFLEELTCSLVNFEIEDPFAGAAETQTIPSAGLAAERLRGRKQRCTGSET